MYVVNFFRALATLFNLRRSQDAAFWNFRQLYGGHHTQQRMQQHIFFGRQPRVGDVVGFLKPS